MSLRWEYCRKVRITRGLVALAYKRALLNSLRYGAFAWVLFGDEVCRWLVPWAMPSLFAVGGPGGTSAWARVAVRGPGALGPLAGLG